MNLYTAIQQLSDEQRIEARSRAASIVVKAVGDKPRREQFSHASMSKYPAWMNRLILSLSCVALLAAFGLSAMHVFDIGSKTFSASIPDRNSAIAAGLFSVLLAEVAQVLFSLALAVLPTSRTSNRLLYGSMFGATLIALVGNIQSANPADAFSWILAVLPPLLVLSTSYILKEQMLLSIGQRWENERQYQEAVHSWQTAANQPEKHPRYQPALNNALKQAIIEHNGQGAGQANRRALMAAFTVDHWRALVWRELQADDWYNSDQQLPEPPALPIVDTPRKRVEVQTENNPFGSIPRAPADQESTAVIERVGEYASSANGNGRH